MSLLENHISMVSDTFDGLCGKGGFPAGTLILGAWTKIFGLTDFPSTLSTSRFQLRLTRALCELFLARCKEKGICWHPTFSRGKTYRFEGQGGLWVFFCPGGSLGMLLRAFLVHLGGKSESKRPSWHQVGGRTARDTAEMGQDGPRWPPRAASLDF